MCPDCIPIGRLARKWNVRRKLIHDLVRAGKLSLHEHGEHSGVTKESVQECLWLIALRKVQAEDEAA